MIHMTKGEMQLLHYPRLDTVLMVEEAIREAGNYRTRMELWRGLPRKVQYQTFKTILDYLLDSKKILITKDGKIMWVLADSPKAARLLRTGVRFDARAADHQGV